MGQFKPMVKMETTEPSVELKLKKGGAVKKMQMGGSMGSPMMSPSVPARGGDSMAAAPMKPTMAARRRAMMARPSGAAPAGPVGMAGRMMKEGGESKSEHKAEMKKFSKLEGELKSHEGKPASKAHKGLKTGGVVNGQGGFKEGGIIKTMTNKTTQMRTTNADRSPATTGDVKMGNAGGYATGGVAKANGGGYKKGGAPKKAFATGGVVNSGRPVAMPQGNKRPTPPVSINQLSGTYKKGGAVMMADGGSASDEKIPSEVQADLQTRRNQKAYEAFEKSRAEEAKADRDMLPNLVKRAAGSVKRFLSPAPAASTPGSVTKTEKSVTVTPKKSGGAVTC